jgi:hypothetical protein
MINNDKDAHSAFVYNSDDGLQWIALASKPQDSGDVWDWTPPANKTHLYTVLIHRWPGGGAGIIGSATGDKDATFTFDGQHLIVS